MNATSSLLAHSLSWALLYSLWQGLLIYGTLYVILKALPAVNSRIKYYLSYGALSALFLWFADTWLIQYQKLKGITVYITQQAVDNGAAATLPVNTFATTRGHSALLDNLLPGMEHYFPFIIIVYAAGLLFMIVRFLLGLSQLRGLRQQGLELAGEHWDDFVSHWQKQFAIGRTVKLYLSSRVNVPMMLGVLKPIILLPVATMSHLSTEQVEAILLHELAHIKRHDYLMNMAQALIETILFFNPFVWLVSGLVRKEREHCCDDIVVATAASPLPYAKALAMLEGTITHNKLSVAANGHKHQLFNRIKRIMEMKKKNLSYSQLAIVLVATAAITLTIAMFTFTPSFAQKAKKDDSDTTKKTSYHTKTVVIDDKGKRTVTEHTSSKKDKADDDIDVDVNVSMNDDDNGKSHKGKTYAYTYTYNDGDDIKKAVKEITIATTNLLGDVQNQLNSVDWDQVRDEINKSIDEVSKELNDPKMSKEINESIRKSLEKTRDALEKVEEKMHDVPMPPVPPVAPAAPLPPAPGFHEVHSGNYETMLDKMEKDGLIDRAGDFKVRKEDGELYINGKKQPDDVYNKYKKYLKDNSVNIKGKKGTLTITVDN